MSSPSTRGRIRLLALAGGLIVGLVVAEALLRIGDVRPERYRAPRWSAFDGTAFRRSDMWGDGRIKQPSPFAGIDMGQYTPGARFRIEYASNPRDYFDSDNGVEMTVNPMGLRGPEVSAEKTAGTLRVIGLGDSFTFGVGVRDEHTFLRRLEGRLNQYQLVEVLNAGTQGYNTRDQQITLENRWLALKPDLVLVVFYLNDIYRDESAVAFWNNGEGHGVYLQPTGLARHSHLIDWCQYSWRAKELRQRMIAHYSQAYFTDPQAFFAKPVSRSQPMDWSASRAALVRIVELARTHGFQVGLAIFPELMSLEDYPFTAIHAFVEETCKEIGMPVHDLLSAFQGHSDHQLWVHPTDHHPNEIAHDLAAASLEKFLRTLIAADASLPQASQSP
jgi:lysophospholipase L1-like esterase